MNEVIASTSRSPTTATPRKTSSAAAPPRRTHCCPGWYRRPSATVTHPPAAARKKKTEASWFERGRQRLTPLNVFSVQGSAPHTTRYLYGRRIGPYPYPYPYPYPGLQSSVKRLSFSTQPAGPPTHQRWALMHVGMKLPPPRVIRGTPCAGGSRTSADVSSIRRKIISSASYMRSDASRTREAPEWHPRRRCGRNTIGQKETPGQNTTGREERADEESKLPPSAEPL